MAIAHKVKCLYCEQFFDAQPEGEGIVWIKPRSNRYAHKECAEKAPAEPEAKPKAEPKKKKESDPESADLNALKDYISELYGEKANWPLIMKQIKRFHGEMRMTYSSIYKTLEWFYDIQNNSVNDSNGGIGIVEFAAEPAKDYYYKIWLAQQQNTNSLPIVEKVKQIFIKKPQRDKKNLHLFNIEE